MNEREPFLHYGFWLLALLWLPAAVAATAAVRFAGGALMGADPGAALNGGGLSAGPEWALLRGTETERT